ncbi:fatty acid desaturase [Nonomuraea sp. NPDC046802]|uniref:fatty acid desaturase family protein n=1 Tax=Nonomuraea sp. NPDC046802 TaxID=3154919 RepID=UPI0033E33EDA
MLVWSRRQARASRGLTRFIARPQAFLFFPLLLLEGLNLHVAGLRALRNRAIRHRFAEGALLLASFAGYLAVLLTDLALGGLNYQIEHHLFSSMPTPHLRRAQPIVRAYCAELGVPYHETSLFASCSEAIRHPHQVGAPSGPPNVEQQPDQTIRPPHPPEGRQEEKT